MRRSLRLATAVVPFVLAGALLVAPTASAQSDATVWLDVKRESLRCDGDSTNVVVRVTRFGEPLRDVSVVMGGGPVIETRLGVFTGGGLVGQTNARGILRARVTPDAVADQEGSWLVYANAGSGLDQAVLPCR
jgi:hypothetical protein